MEKGVTMKFLNPVSLVSLALMGITAQAQPPGSVLPGGGTDVQEVFVNFESDTITIRGDSLVPEADSRLVVTLGALNDPVFGDISSYCALSDPQTISCDFSGSYDLTGDDAGDYLLTVSIGNGQSQSDEYDLTIGAVGPKGDRGDKGDKGDQGPPGAASIYVKFSEINLGNDSSLIRCDSGDQATGGGVSIQSTAVDKEIYRSVPYCDQAPCDNSTNVVPTAWLCSVRSTPPDYSPIRCYVVCADLAL